VRLRNLGWEKEEERERLARDIKRSLFSSQLRRGTDQRSSEQGDELQKDQPGSIGNGPEVSIDRSPREDPEDKLRHDFGGVIHHDSRVSCGFEIPVADGGEIDRGMEVFGRSIEDIFNHSWRKARGARWIWARKPMVMVAQEFPA
jgi:hypothetical protein